MMILLLLLLCCIVVFVQYEGSLSTKKEINRQSLRKDMNDGKQVQVNDDDRKEDERKVNNIAIFWNRQDQSYTTNLIRKSHRSLSLLSIEENLLHSLEENEIKTEFVGNDTATSEIEPTDKAKYILENGTPETSIYHFLKACKHKMYILKWNRNGILDKHSQKSYWWVGESYDTVPPSEYGTVALLVDQDNVHDSIPFDIIPPVPILFFSIERKYENEYHKLIVDAFGK